jgi:hypothetical protein
MIVIQYAPDRTKVLVQGHANYRPLGQDIVCAGVSALFYTLEASLQQLAHDKTAWKPCQADKHAFVLETSKDNPMSSVFVESFLLGTASIAATYPEHVQVRELTPTDQTGSL